MDERSDMLGTIRREAIRAVLERAQGEMLKYAGAGPSEGDDAAPEGVAEELDIAYINRQGIPLAMDIIGPANTEGVELPVVVTIHGGGLVTGDRRLSRAYARQLALRGYLVFSIEYRLAPRANVCEQLDDVCAGMDLVGERLVDFDVDFGRMFLTAESAGAYLAVYVAAMKDSPKLQKAIGYEPTRMRFRALGLISGMFYTNKPDPIGVLFSDQFYGDKRADEEFLRYMDPEHREIVSNLPPCYFVTSRGDFLNSYTIEYHQAVKGAGKETHLLYFGEDDLAHAFVTLRPDLEQSQRAIDKMCAWFEVQAEHARAGDGLMSEEAERLVALRERMDSGAICHQKSWQFIRELNSATEARLDRVALKEEGRSYTYRQLFRAEERYAEVFSALGITQDSGSRVGVATSISAECIIAFYALNMLGVSTSMFRCTDLLVKRMVKRTVRTEGITDLLVPDTCVDAELLHDLVRLKRSLGLRHVIVLHASKGRLFDTPYDALRAKQNYRELKKVKGVLFMSRLLREHGATPISYGDASDDEAAVIVHTSGTTKFVHKPIPLSDLGLNAAAARFFDDEDFTSLVGKAVTTIVQPPYSSYTLVDMVHLPLSMGCTIALPSGIEGPIDGTLAADARFARFLAEEGVNVLFAFPRIFGVCLRDPQAEGLDLSQLAVVVFGGGAVSNDQLRESRKDLSRFGAHPALVIGYGLSECGGATILHRFDGKVKKGRSEMGIPLKGVHVLIQDEEDGSFHRMEDGPRVGVLHIASDSNSSGRLGADVLFEPVEVEGESYVCTNDLVRVNESGRLIYVGRANRYFLNDAGRRFEASVVETALSMQPGIAACAIVPAFDRFNSHDTVPRLYVQLSQGRHQRKTVRKALMNAYVREGTARGNDLPWLCVVCDELPLNEAGKVDVARIMTDDLTGDAYRVSGVEEDGRLVDVRVVRSKDLPTQLLLSDAAGIPKKLMRERRTWVRNYLRVYGMEGAKLALALMGAGKQDDESFGRGVDGLGQGMPAYPMPWGGMQDDGLQGGLAMAQNMDKKLKKQMKKRMKEARKAMKRMSMMPGMPQMGQIPMMPMGPESKKGSRQMPFDPAMLTARPPKKGKKAPAGFIPMMPMGPAPKTRKKGKKGHKAPAGFAPMMPMMPLGLAPRKGKKDPKVPMGFAPMMMPMPPMMMPPAAPAPKPRKRPKNGRRF